MRILSSIVLFLFLIYMPFWAVFLMLVSLILLFNEYYEALFLGFIGDLIYAPEALLSNAYALQYFITFTIALIVIEMLKTRLRFY